MEKLPEGFKTEDYKKYLNVIDPYNLHIGGWQEFYNYGVNCRIVLKDDLEKVKKVLETVGTLSKEQTYWFWRGYWYGIEKIIDKEKSEKGVIINDNP